MADWADSGGGGGGRGADDGATSAAPTLTLPPPRPPPPHPPPCTPTVFVLDLDETLILFNAFMNGTWAASVGASPEVGEGGLEGCEGWGLGAVAGVGFVHRNL